MQLHLLLESRMEVFHLLEHQLIKHLNFHVLVIKAIAQTEQLLVMDWELHPRLWL